MNDRLDMTLDDIIRQDRRDRFGRTSEPAWKCPNGHCNYWYYRRSWHLGAPIYRPWWRRSPSDRLLRKAKNYFLRTRRPYHQYWRRSDICQRDHYDSDETSENSEFTEASGGSHMRVTIPNNKNRRRFKHPKISPMKSYYQNQALLESAKRLAVEPIDSEEKEDDFQEKEKTPPKMGRKFVTLNERFSRVSRAKPQLMEVDCCDLEDGAIL